MEQREILKQMVEFNKTAFDNSFSAMLLLQEQTERMVTTLVEQSTWLPEQGQKVLEDVGIEPGNHVTAYGIKGYGAGDGSN